MVVHIDLFIFLCICSCRFVSRSLIFFFLRSSVLFSCTYQSLIIMILVKVWSDSIQKLSMLFSIILNRVKFSSSLLYEMEVQPPLLLECLSNSNYENLLEVLWINGLWKQILDETMRWRFHCWTGRTVAMRHFIDIAVVVWLFVCPIHRSVLKRQKLRSPRFFRKF